MESTMDKSASAPDMSAQERFFKYFQHEIIALQDQMARVGSTPGVGGEWKDATDHCLAGITRLASEVKDASSSLPSYDVRSYSEAIKALQEKLAEIMAAFAPKQKFAFKTRKNASAISLNDAAEMAAQKRHNIAGVSSAYPTSTPGSSFATTPVYIMTPPNEQSTKQSIPPAPPPTRDEAMDSLSQNKIDGEGRPDLDQSLTSTIITSQSSAHITVPASATRTQSPCQISNVQACCISLSAPNTDPVPFASLTINKVESSLLLCGSISGPAHITGVTNSIIVLDCRQFRMHECENVDIYLYCTSRPIIEDCKNVRFAEMPSPILDVLYPSIEKATLSPNLWNQIDDFKWLKAEQSPNWSVLPSEEQISSSIWDQIIPGKPETDAEQLLTAVGLQK